MRSLDPLPDVPYQGLLRREPPDVVRLVMCLLLGLGTFVVASFVTQAALVAGWQLSGRPGAVTDYVADGIAFRHPVGMLAAHLGLMSLVPLVILVLRYVGELRTGWVHSVQPGFRWRLALLVAGATLLVLGASVVLLGRLDLGNPRPQAGFWWFLLVVVLTSPLQAAGEEYLFRGLLMTTLGGFVRNPWFGIVASALVFALFHGVQSPPLFLDRFAFGVLAGVLVWRTGGLEAGVAIHAVNNVLAFTAAGLWGTIADARAVKEITWAAAAGDVATFAVAAGIAWAVARRLHCATTTPGAPVLRADSQVR